MPNALSKSAREILKSALSKQKKLHKLGGNVRTAVLSHPKSGKKFQQKRKISQSILQKNFPFAKFKKIWDNRKKLFGKQKKFFGKKNILIKQHKHL